MPSQAQFDVLLNEAKKMYAQGHPDKYIVFQFVEQGVDDATIDTVIKIISDLRKSNRKSKGMKLALIGSSFAIMSVLITLAFFQSSSPVAYVLWGLMLGGLTMAAKGVGDMLGL